MQTTVSLGLDKRKIRKDHSFTIILRIGHFQRTTSISTGKSVPLHFWDESKRKVKSSYKGVQNVSILNQLLHEELGKAQDIINQLEIKGELRYLSINQLKERIVQKKSYTSFLLYGIKLQKELVACNRIGTARSYGILISRLRSFTNNRDLKFNEINFDFLKKFEKFHLAREGNSVNGLAAYLRTIRAIFNKAIKEKIIEREAYPFYDYTIKTKPTAKRAIRTESLKKLLNTELKQGTWPFHYRNYFLISYLLFGMSFIDLAYLKKKNIVDGRIKFQRKKTSKAYNILITEELMKFLSFYAEGKEKNDFIFPIITAHDPQIQYNQVTEARSRYNRGLKKLAEECGIEEHLTSYVSRHSFATHAMFKEIPLHAISAMLGHSKLTTTQIYLKSLPSDALDKYHRQLTLC